MSYEQALATSSDPRRIRRASSPATDQTSSSLGQTSSSGKKAMSSVRGERSEKIGFRNLLSRSRSSILSSRRSFFNVGLRPSSTYGDEDEENADEGLYGNALDAESDHGNENVNGDMNSNNHQVNVETVAGVLQESLDSINPSRAFRKRQSMARMKRDSLAHAAGEMGGYSINEGVLILEVPSTGEAVKRTITLRELYQEIGDYSKLLDKEGLERRSVTTNRSSTSSTSSNSNANANTNATSTQPPSSPSLSDDALPMTKTPSYGNLSGGTTAAPPKHAHVPAPSSIHAILNAHDDDDSAVLEIRLRDLRRLDFGFNPHQEPVVIVRKHSVMFCLDQFRAIIMHNKLIFVVPDGADSLLEVLEKYLKDWTPEDEQGVDGWESRAFEIHAYEAMLVTVKTMQHADVEILEKEVRQLLNKTKTRHGSLLSVATQEKMRNCKNSLTDSITKVASYSRALNDLMEDDKAMALMNLSKLSRKPSLYQLPLSPEIMRLQDEVEELIEVYLMDFNNIENKLVMLRSQIQSAEELIFLRLDTSRNELLIANTALTIFSCTTAFGAYFTGVFGMNLDNATGMPTGAIQEAPWGFTIVFCVTFAIIFFGWASIFTYFRWAGVIPVRVKDEIN